MAPPSGSPCSGSSLGGARLASSTPGPTVSGRKRGEPSVNRKRRGLEQIETYSPRRRRETRPLKYFLGMMIGCRRGWRLGGAVGGTPCIGRPALDRTPTKRELIVSYSMGAVACPRERQTAHGVTKDRFSVDFELGRGQLLGLGVPSVHRSRLRSDHLLRRRGQPHPGADDDEQRSTSSP